MCGRSSWRLWEPMALAAFAIPLYAQAPAPRPPDLFVTRLQGPTTDSVASIGQGAPERPRGLQPLPVTELDDRLRTAELDGPRRVSLTVSRPMPLRDLLVLLVNGTPLSLVTDETVDGTFIGDLKDLTMRQALEAVLFPRGLDYDVQGTLVRVFPRKATTRLFNVNYLNVRRSWQRGVRSTVPGARVPAAELSSSSDTDLFDELGKGVQALLSESGSMHLDRGAGLVQVTDFSDRLDQVGVYVEAVELRATRQVRIDAHVFEVAFAEGGATSIDWKAVAARAGAAPRAPVGHGTAGLTVADVDLLKKAIAEQGVVTMIAAPQFVSMNNEPAVMVLEGLTLTVIAQISADGIVQLNVAPSYTPRTGPSKAGVAGTLPSLRASEADTLVRVRDGETVVLSGFLAEHEKSKPATRFAAMFNAESHTTVKSELVILLTPSIVTPGVPAAAAAR